MVEKEGTSHALGDVSFLVPVLKRVAADKISDRFCNGFAPKRVIFLSIRFLLSSYRVAKLNGLNGLNGFCRVQVYRFGPGF